MSKALGFHGFHPRVAWVGCAGAGLIGLRPMPHAARTLVCKILLLLGFLIWPPGLKRFGRGRAGLIGSKAHAPLAARSRKFSDARLPSRGGSHLAFPLGG